MTKKRNDRYIDAGLAILTSSDLTQPQTQKEAAENLVRAHRAEDPDLVDYFASAQDEVQLIEVTPSVADTDEVVSFRFGVNENFELAYDLRLILLNPAESQRLRDGKLRLPRGWCKLDSFEMVAA